MGMPRVRYGNVKETSWEGQGNAKAKGTLWECQGYAMGMPRECQANA